MAWIAPADVTAVYPSDAPTKGFLDHLQTLAEIEVGTQEAPIKACLKALLVDISHRLAPTIDDDDPNVTQTSLGSWSQSRKGGLGLTDREIAKLKKCAGLSSLHVQPTTRSAGGLETHGRLGRDPADTVFVDDASGGDPIPWETAPVE
jgi:hypothetical protein